MPFMLQHLTQVKTVISLVIILLKTLHFLPSKYYDFCKVTACMGVPNKQHGKKFY